MRTLHFEFKQVRDLNEIIFANRNKAYGAYELRKHYHERLLKAFMITASALLLILLFIAFILNRKPSEVNGYFFTTKYDTVKTFTIEEVKVHQAASPRQHTRTDQLPPVISNDSTLQQKEKFDSTKVTASLNNSSPKGDSIYHGNNTGGTEIKADTFSQRKNGEVPYNPAPEVMPSFPGGNTAFAKYVQKHFNCIGSSVSEENTTGKIILRFVIMKDGSVSNIEVLLNSVGIDCLNKAKSMLMSSPKWNPGLQNNQPVNVQMVLPITVERQ